MRIIPAYAGSTGPVAAMAPAGMDHPRIRGEHVFARLISMVRSRIIPAYAGSTCH